jgi:hypothetical protein
MAAWFSPAIWRSRTSAYLSWKWARAASSVGGKKEASPRRASTKPRAPGCGSRAWRAATRACGPRRRPCAGRSPGARRGHADEALLRVRALVPAQVHREAAAGDEDDGAHVGVVELIAADLAWFRKVDHDGLPGHHGAVVLLRVVPLVVGGLQQRVALLRLARAGAR